MRWCDLKIWSSNNRIQTKHLEVELCSMHCSSSHSTSNNSTTHPSIGANTQREWLVEPSIISVSVQQNTSVLVEFTWVRLQCKKKTILSKYSSHSTESSTFAVPHCTRRVHHPELQQKQLFRWHPNWCDLYPWRSKFVEFQPILYDCRQLTQLLFLLPWLETKYRPESFAFVFKNEGGKRN